MVNDMTIDGYAVARSFLTNISAPSLTAAKRSPAYQLPRTDFIKRIVLRLKGQHDTSATSAATWEDLMGEIQNIIIKADGKDIFHVPGKVAKMMDEYQYGLKGEETSIVQTGATANNLVYATLFIDFYDPNKPNKYELLPAMLFRSLDLYLDFGAPANCGTNMTWDSVSVDVVVEYVPNDGQWDNELENFKINRKIVHEIGGLTAGTGNELNIDLGHKLRNLFVVPLDGSTVALDTSLITDFTVRKDNKFNIIDEVPYALMRQEDYIQYRLGAARASIMIEFPDMDTSLLSSLKFKPKVTTGQPDDTSAVIKVLVNDIIERRG